MKNIELEEYITMASKREYGDTKKKDTRDGFKIRCPLHNDNTPSLHVFYNKDKGTPGWCCNVCRKHEKGGKYLDFIMCYEQISKSEAEVELKKLQPSAPMSREDMIKSLNEDVDARKMMEDKFEPDAELEAYFKDVRKLDTKYIKEYKIRKRWVKGDKISETPLNGYTKSMVIPLLDIEGTSIGWQSRSIEGGKMHGHSTKRENVSKYSGLAGLIQNKEHIKKAGCVYIVEGACDLFSMMEIGIKNVISTGINIPPKAILGLRKMGVTEAIVVFDSDEDGGRRATQSTCRLLSTCQIKPFYIPFTKIK